jgi:hypothetical protein
MKAEGCTLKAKRRKESAGACVLAVNEQRTILLPKRPHFLTLFAAVHGAMRSWRSCPRSRSGCLIWHVHDTMSWILYRPFNDDRDMY